MSTEFTYRKSIRNLSDEEVQLMRLAYQKLMEILDNRGYVQLAGYHGAPNWWCWHHGVRWRDDMRTRLFLPWHRAYLLAFENAAKDQLERANEDSAKFGLPYWDWSSDASRQEGLPSIFTEQTVDGNDNPLYSARALAPATRLNPQIDKFTERNPDIPSALPTKDDVDTALQASTYGEFSDVLENIHDRIHVWVGGDMSNPTTSAFDPIFWSHHCMIDRLWWIWQNENSCKTPAAILDLPLRPFELTVSDVLNIYDRGYEYVSSDDSFGGTNP